MEHDRSSSDLTESWRIVFMGTPAFACPVLESLLARPDPVVGVICQPDRPRGRGLAVVAPEVKRLAAARGVSVLQPARLRDAEFLEALGALGPDLIVVAAYGRLLPPAVLALPPRGCINVHPSLLPRHRGAAPIPWTILAGDTVTGVTIMQMVEEMDAGDVLLQREVPLTPAETTGSLTARLAGVAATLLGETIDGLRAGTIHPVPQADESVTYAPRIERAQHEIDWSRPAVDLDRIVRALAPRPSAFTTLGGRRLKVLRSRAEAGSGEAPARVLAAGPDGIVAGTGAGTLRLLVVQLEGRRALSAGEFLAGHPLAPGTCLGGD